MIKNTAYDLYLPICLRLKTPQSFKRFYHYNKKAELSNSALRYSH
ncbi:uncharacterized protein METZ01_LOCUS44679 [marine metagenome]|uniref:Uncharacterized protein n=1 Tax=marine metagenome TaxID=408172 RepID=A0A381RJ29_9ZZZZ